MSIEESPLLRQSDPRLGRPDYSRYSRDHEQRIQLSWQNLPRGHARLFRQWLRDILDDSNKPFTIALDGDSYTARFLQKPRCTAISGNGFSYSAVIIARRIR